MRLFGQVKKVQFIILKMALPLLLESNHHQLVCLELKFPTKTTLQKPKKSKKSQKILDSNIAWKVDRHYHYISFRLVVVVMTISTNSLHGISMKVIAFIINMTNPS